jgi:hypothetical protein
MKLLEILIKAFSVKKTLALMTGGVFFYLAIVGIIEPQYVMNIVSLVFGMYFGQSIATHNQN